LRGTLIRNRLWPTANFLKKRVPLNGIRAAEARHIPEIRFTVTDKLDYLITRLSGELGVSKAEYIKSLVLRDLRKNGLKAGREKDSAR